jgi:nitrous oxidase accessory protein NosD
MFFLKSSALVVLVLAGGSLHPSAGNLVCPTGTRAAANSCVLDSDLVLTEALELPSFTTLNCRGHRLLPSSVGTGTTPDTHVPSVPALAIAIMGDRGVNVRNCLIGQDGSRFDFGILAINSKQVGEFGHRIHNNEIHARDAGILLLRVDDARINDNLITWSNGFGISFARDSDRNRVTGNIMSSAGAPPATTRLVPDGPFRNLNDDAIFLVALHAQPLYNLVIAQRLYQFPNSEDGQYAAHEDNVLEGNRLSLPGPSGGKSHQGIEVGSNALRTRVTGNTITEAAVGISLRGLRPAESVSRPGRCQNPAVQGEVRFCQTDADCFIPGIDVAPVGTCSGVVTEVRDLRARDSVVEDNTLIGPFNSTASMRSAICGGNGTVGGIIRRNQIFGTGVEPGITLAGHMIETGQVTGNVVHGASFGLMLQQGPATTSGARVFLNDITGSTIRAVGVLEPYSLQTDLSWQGVGNYWGHAAPPCFRSSDSPIPGLVQDLNPFCIPVADSVTSDRR